MTCVKFQKQTDKGWIIDFKLRASALKFWLVHSCDRRLNRPFWLVHCQTREIKIRCDENSVFNVKDHFTFWDSYRGADFAEEKFRLKSSPKRWIRDFLLWHFSFASLLVSTFGPLYCINSLIAIKFFLAMIRKYASRSIHSGFETVLFKIAFLRAVLSSLYWIYHDTMFSCSLQDYFSFLLRLSLRIINWYERRIIRKSWVCQ